MKQISIVGEDALCCSLGEQLVKEAMPGWQVHGRPTNTGGVTKLLPALSRFAKLAKHVRPVLCVADTDHRCPVELIEAHMPVDSPSSFFFRLAVPEAECWVLADRSAVASYFQVNLQIVPSHPEQLGDAKQEVLKLAKRSKVRQIRNEVVSDTNPLRQGTGYNLHLSEMVSEHWRAGRAAENAPSLHKAFARLRALAMQHQ